MNCDDAGVFTNVEDCEPLIHLFAAERKQYVLLKRSNVSLQQTPWWELHDVATGVSIVTN